MPFKCIQGFHCYKQYCNMHPAHTYFYIPVIVPLCLSLYGPLDLTLMWTTLYLSLSPYCCGHHSNFLEYQLHFRLQRQLQTQILLWKVRNGSLHHGVWINNFSHLVQMIIFRGWISHSLPLHPATQGKKWVVSIDPSLCIIPHIILIY